MTQVRTSVVAQLAYSLRKTRMVVAGGGRHFLSPTPTTELVRQALAHVRELERRDAEHLKNHFAPAGFGPHSDEAEEVKDLVHDLCIAWPEADPQAVWRGWTLRRNVPSGRRYRFRVAVSRVTQLAVGRCVRARVEDGFAVTIDGTVAGVWTRKEAMKQARWATMVGADGKLPLLDRTRGRSRRKMLFLAQWFNRRGQAATHPRQHPANGGA